MIEQEYNEMIDHVIILSNDCLKIVYNNYHERMYLNIIHKMSTKIDQAGIRRKDYCNNIDIRDVFVDDDYSTLNTDHDTLDILHEMSTGMKHATERSKDNRMGIIIQLLDSHKERSLKFNKPNQESNNRWIVEKKSEIGFVVSFN